MAVDTNWIEPVFMAKIPANREIIREFLPFVGPRSDATMSFACKFNGLRQDSAR